MPVYGIRVYATYPQVGVAGRIQLRIEARAFDDGKRVGGLAPGKYHVRVSHFMDSKTWSEGLLTIDCGDVVKAEVREGSGLKVLNRSEKYRRQ